MSGAFTETERRFLVDVALWDAASVEATREHLVQVYLAAARERTVRIRLHADRAVLTIKGASTRGSRTEIECDIDMDAARAVLDTRLFKGSPVEKTRCTIRVGGLAWEVDQFEGANAGLVIAEVELTGAQSRGEWDEQVDRGRPAWAVREITGESRFSNSSLALRPFAEWPAEERDAVLHAIARSEAAADGE